MDIQGSCHCGTVQFSAHTHTPHPYMWCYCSICRKTAGGGGYAINIMAEADTLHVDGTQHVSRYQARIRDPDDPAANKVSPAVRHFCGVCGSALWIADPRWPEWIYPFASAIDTALPVPPEHTRIMLEFAAPWCEIPQGPSDQHYAGYPDVAIIDWHKQRGLYEES